MSKEIDFMELSKIRSEEKGIGLTEAMKQVHKEYPGLQDRYEAYQKAVYQANNPEFANKGTKIRKEFSEFPKFALTQIMAGIASLDEAKLNFHDYLKQQVKIAEDRIASLQQRISGKIGKGSTGVAFIHGGR